MIVILAIAFLYVSTVDGCNRSSPDPLPVEAPALVLGAYTVTVTGVEQVECRGARPAEFLGLAADGWLAADRQSGSDAVRFDLDGLMFRGGMAEGMIRVRGQPGEPEPVEASEAAPTSAPEAPSFARITATVIDAHHASGVLDVHTADCSYTLNIAIEGALKDTAVVDPGGDDTGAVEPVDPGDDTGAVEPGDPADTDTGSDDTGCG